MSATAQPSHGIQNLRPAFSGELHQPGDPGYDEARLAWNLAVDQTPAAVALPRTVEDVQAVVAFAREQGLRVAPQGTGHNATPLGPLHESVLLKTSLMRGVEVDPILRVARLKAGTLSAELLAAAGRHGLAPISGSSPDISYTGFTLGGGIGWLSRKLGLAANSVVAIDAVLADGRHVRCDADHEPELFWALRGGGGSYAIVTALEIRLYRLPEVYAGAMLWPWERASEVLHRWREWTLDAPEEVTTSARILQLPPLPDIPEAFRGRQFVAIDGAVMGDAAEAERILAPLRALEPEADLFGMMPSAGLCHVHMDPEQPVPGIGDHAMLAELPPEAIDAFVELGGPGSGSPLLVLELRHLGGALGRVPAHAGALGRLRAPYALFAVGIPMDAGMAEAIHARQEQIRSRLAPWTGESSYLNFAERATDTRTAFSEDAYAALQAIKAELDPGDLIQANHPVPGDDA